MRIGLRALTKVGYTSEGLTVKRCLDVILSGFGLLLSSPAWLLIALAIKLKDGGPIFYHQTRVGMGQRIFRITKFRSMVPNAESNTGPVWASANDRRVTRIGRLLRATALDELPQLLNILIGDMSFVGPRPERPELVSRFREEVPGYDRRFEVKPGLTGLAQVYGKYDSGPREKLRYDLLYVLRQRLGLDLRLILASVWISLAGRWERRERKFASRPRVSRGASLGGAAERGRLPEVADDQAR